jgi:hypothetical protein
VRFHRYSDLIAYCGVSRIYLPGPLSRFENNSGIQRGTVSI